MEDNFDVIERIKELCNQKHMSYYRLSKLSNIPTSTLSNYLRRGNAPSLYTIEKLCKAFDMSLSQFFANADQKYPSLTDKQQDILDMYSSLSDQDKALAHAYLSGLCHKDSAPNN